MGLRGIGDTTEIELGIGWNWMVTRSAYTETSFLPSTKPIPCLQTGDCGILFNIFFSARILVCFGKIVFNWDFTRNLLMMSLSTFLWNLYVGLSLFCCGCFNFNDQVYLRAYKLYASLDQRIYGYLLVGSVFFFVCFLIFFFWLNSNFLYKIIKYVRFLFVLRKFNSWKKFKKNNMFLWIS